jgi:hypothetical protein
MVLAMTMPNSPLFYFISSNKWVAIIRLAVVGSMIWLSWGGYLKDERLRRLLSRIGAGLIVLGSWLLVSQLNFVFSDVVKPLDILLTIEAGVIISLTALVAAPKTKAKPPKLQYRKT